MKKLCLIIILLMACLSTWAETSMEIVPVTDGRWAVELFTTDIYSEIPDSNWYAISIDFSPSGEDDVAEFFSIAIVWVDPNDPDIVQNLVFTSRQAIVSIQSTDSILKGKFTKTLNPIVGGNGNFLTTANQEDIDYLIALFYRNDGDIDMHISEPNKTGGYFVNLDFDVDLFGELYLRCAAANRYGVDYNDTRIDRIINDYQSQLQ